jgi:hypothetical protein
VRSATRAPVARPERRVCARTRGAPRGRRAPRLACAVLALAVSAGSAPAQIAAGRVVRAAVLSGVVTDTSGVPVPGATVAVERGGSAVTALDGRFVVSDLRPGRTAATVRRLGFLPADFELDLPAGTRVDLAARLVPSPTPLPTVIIDGERRELLLHANGYYDRARTANGRFLGPEFLDQRRHVQLSVVLRETPRVQVQCERAGARCRALVGVRACEARVWVDGTPAPDGALDEVVPRQRVRAVEVYASAPFVPGDFVRPGDTCGAIAIWTELAPSWSRYLPRRRLRLPPAGQPPAGQPPAAPDSAVRTVPNGG